MFSVGGVSCVQCGRSLLCSVWEELVVFSVGGVSCVQLVQFSVKGVCLYELRICMLRPDSQPDRLRSRLTRFMTKLIC